MNEALSLGRRGGEGPAGRGMLITLIKPQFEVGKDQVGKGGVVRDEALHVAVCEEIADWVNGLDGWTVIGVTDSPITGPAGNKEFLLLAQKER